MTADRPKPYQVILTGRTQDEFREPLRAAARAGRWAEVKADGLALHRALEWVPETVAEPVYERPRLGRVHIGSFRAIQVRFAVNDDERTVTVAWVRLLPSAGD